MVVEPEGVLVREMVCSPVSEADRLTGFCIGSRVAVVLYVALAALEFRIIRVQEGNLSGIAPNTHIDDLKIRSLRIFVPQGISVGLAQGVDQGIPHYPGFCRVGIVACKTIKAVRKG